MAVWPLTVTTGAASDIQMATGIARRHEVRQALVGVARGLRPLLPQMMQHCHDPLPRFVGIQLEVVADRVGGPEANHAARLQPAEQGRPGIAQVEQPGRAGRKTRDERRHRERSVRDRGRRLTPARRRRKRAC